MQSRLGLEPSKRHFETFGDKGSDKYRSNPTPEGGLLLLGSFDGKQVQKKKAKHVLRISCLKSEGKVLLKVLQAGWVGNAVRLDPSPWVCTAPNMVSICYLLQYFCTNCEL